MYHREKKFSTSAALNNNAIPLTMEIKARQLRNPSAGFGRRRLTREKRRRQRCRGGICQTWRLCKRYAPEPFQTHARSLDNSTSSEEQPTTSHLAFSHPRANTSKSSLSSIFVALQGSFLYPASSASLDISPVIFAVVCLRKSVTMASAARSVSRVFARASPAAPSSSIRSSARSARFAVPAQAFRASGRRGYASGPDAKSSGGLIWGLGALALGGAGALYYLSADHLGVKTDANFVPTKADYQKVYDEIANLLIEKDEWDDGSYGPVRLIP